MSPNHLDISAPLSQAIGTASHGPIIPVIISDAGDRAAGRFLEFFTATIRNANTRAAYARPVLDFFVWCERYRLILKVIEPIHVATYIEAMTASRSAHSVKQHLAARR